MLFFNIDHIEPELLPETRKASSSFFEGSSRMCEFFAYMENNDMLHAPKAALQAAEAFELSASLFEALSTKIKGNYSWIRNVVKDVRVEEAAHAAQLDPKSEIVQRMNSELFLNDVQIDGVLMRTAHEISGMAEYLRDTSERMCKPHISSEHENQRAHQLLGDWRTLVARGQYISSVCMLTARVGAQD
jgi:hypothetical protein